MSESNAHPGHDIAAYGDENPYRRENDLMGDRYVALIRQHDSSLKSFLELGIGFGKTLELLSQHVGELAVVDGEPRLIESVREHYPVVSFHESMFEEFTTDDRYQGIGMGFVLDLVSDPAAMLRQYASFLAPDGRIYVCVECAGSLHRRIAHAAGLLPDLRQMSKFNEAYGHQRFATYEDWMEIFEDSGMTVTHTFGLFLKPLTTAQIESLNLDDRIYRALGTVAKDYPEISNACFFVLER